MDINKKNRSDLKSYFVKNSIPTQSNFAELIDGMLNQKDDGIVKSPDALSIEATGDLAGLQRVINFYAKFQDANPAWSLQLNPRTDPNIPETAKEGFCVADGFGSARLFIDKTTGNVGVGTTAPIAKLDIAHHGLARVDTHPTAIKGLYITADFGEADGVEFRHRNGSQGIGFGFNTIYAAGSNLNQDLQLKPKGTGVMRVLGNVDINGGLKITKDIKFKIGDEPNGGIFFSSHSDMDNPLAWLKFYDMAPGQINRSFSRYMLEIFSDRLAILSTEIQIKGDLTINGRIISEQWIDAKLEKSWVRHSDDYNPPQYFKDNAGIVWLRGMVKGGSSTIFTLPEGYRPSNRQVYVVSICSKDKTTAVCGRVDVTKDGKIEPVVGSSDWTSLDSISFRAAL